jgi:hypothetical protein
VKLFFAVFAKELKNERKGEHFNDQDKCEVPVYEIDADFEYEQKPTPADFKRVIMNRQKMLAYFPETTTYLYTDVITAKHYFNYAEAMDFSDKMNEKKWLSMS